MAKTQRRVRVYLEDGSYVLVPRHSLSDIVGVTEYGDLVIRPSKEESWIPADKYVGLTGCCGATAKGCDGYTGCRACYDEVDSRLGATLGNSDIYMKVRAS